MNREVKAVNVRVEEGGGTEHEEDRVPEDLKNLSQASSAHEDGPDQDPEELSGQVEHSPDKELEHTP